MFRKDKETIKEWSLENVKKCSQRQREILKQAYYMLKPGGELCYSTCTFNKEENEENVHWFLETFLDCKLKPFSITVQKEKGEEVFQGTYKAFPHIIKGEGHFVALFKKEKNETLIQKKTKENIVIQKDILKKYNDFFKKEKNKIPKNVFPTHTINNQLYYFPYGYFQSDFLKKIKPLRLGLHLGEARSSRFIPNHSFAISQILPTEFKRYEVSLEELEWFLQGNTINCDKELKGWCIITFSGIDVTWGKVSEGIIKNHYPKGLRRTIKFFIE